MNEVLPSPIRSMKTELMRRQVRDNLMILILFGVLILLQKSISSWHLMNYDLEQQAAALSLPLKPALQFNDRKEALSSLNILRNHDSIVDARVTTPKDFGFAHYSRDSAQYMETPPGLTWRSYTRTFVILDEGEAIGRLTLVRHLDDIYQGLFFYTLIVIAMGLVVWVASLLFAQSVHAKFSASFHHMIVSMQKLQDSPDPVEMENKAKENVAPFEEIHFILQEFQKMTQAISERDQRLVAANSVLEDKVQERTRELKQLQERLVEEAHKAGMADVASSVLHNFGNILSSISIDCSILREMIKGGEQTRSFHKVLEHLNDERILQDILSAPQKTDSLRRLLREMDSQTLDERQKYQEIVDRMNEQLYLMKDLIYYQQNYATGQALFQTVGLKDLLDLAFNIKLSLLKSSEVKCSIDVPENIPVLVQKTKILHVFANLIVNSIDAMRDVDPEQRSIKVWTEREGAHVNIHFRDIGCGIPKEKSTKIFTLGFTTKQTGHGFGLHSSANYMREMNGSLELENPQPDAGAAFVMRVRIAQTTQDKVGA